jgi:hypothetical protein
MDRRIGPLLFLELKRLSTGRRLGRFAGRVVQVPEGIEEITGDL